MFSFHTFLSQKDKKYNLPNFDSIFQKCVYYYCASVYMYRWCLRHVRSHREQKLLSPICGEIYADVAQHLRVTEQVINRTV